MLNSPQIPAWKAGKNTARTSTQWRAGSVGPHGCCKTRGSMQLRITVGNGSLDISLAGQTYTDIFFAKLAQAAHPSTMHRSITAAHAHGGNPLHPGRWCVQHTSGTARAVKGALWVSR